MSLNYYQELLAYPPINRAIGERLHIYVAETLYPDEILEDGMNKIILSDIGAGGEVQLGDAVKYLPEQSTNNPFPFTAYQPQDVVINTEKKCFMPLSGRYYSSFLNSRVKTRPMEWTINMVSFFTTPADYYRALTVLFDEGEVVKKLWVPVKMNNINTLIPIEIEFEITNGTYTYELEQWQATGKIFGINHNLIINYFDFVLPEGGVYPVDTIEIAISLLTQPPVFIDSGILPNPPEVLSSYPEDDDEGVDPDSTLTSITINFSEPMIEETVEDNFEITPFVGGDFVWDTDGKQLVYDLYEDMQNDTDYYVIITQDAKSEYELGLLEEFELHFKTGS